MCQLPDLHHRHRAGIPHRRWGAVGLALVLLLAVPPGLAAQESLAAEDSAGKSEGSAGESEGSAGGGAAAEGEGDADVEAQKEDSGDEPTPFVLSDVVEVNVVNVDVYVVDKKTGEPVTGLTADDFIITEDKEPQIITNFAEIADGHRVGEEEEKKKKRKKGELVASHPELLPRERTVPEDQRLWLLVYIDNLNIRPFNRNRVFRDLRRFLQTRLDREDRVALMSYNRSLKLERPFTSDSHLISNALYELEKHTGGRVTQDSDRRDVLREIEQGRNPNQAYGRVKLYAESVYNDLQFTLDALKEATSQLGGIPGRKAFLYVSDGLPMRAGEDLFLALEERNRGNQANYIMDGLQYDASRRFRELVNEANANGVTFYTIDAEGLRAAASRGADVGYTELSTAIDSHYQNNMQSTIMYMADETGGQSIVNTNNISGGLEKVAQDFDHYYSIGYTPGHKGTGRYYKIGCDVKMKGVKVRCRDGYRDKTVETEMADGTLASLVFGYQSNPLGVRVEPREAIQREDGYFMQTVHVRIPLDKIALVPFEGFHRGSLRIFYQALDEKGRTSPPAENSLEIEIPQEDIPEALEKYYVFEAKLLMRPGAQRLAVGVRDQINAQSSVLSRVFSVGS